MFRLAEMHLPSPFHASLVRLVPLAPYFFFRSVHSGVIGSGVVTMIALLAFGHVVGQFATAQPFRSAWQTVIVGGLSATAAFAIANMIW